MIAGLASNVQNREQITHRLNFHQIDVVLRVAANQDIEDQLHATPSQISWSLSLFILVQGNVPLLWAAISEIKGRKVIAIVSCLLK